MYVIDIHYDVLNAVPILVVLDCYGKMNVVEQNSKNKHLQCTVLKII